MAHKMIDDHTLSAGLKRGFNGAGKSQSQGGNVKGDGISVSGDDINEFRIFDGLSDGVIVAEENVDKFLTISSSIELEESQNCAKFDSYGLGGVPHDVLFSVFDYLGVEDLLSVERVCKSWRDLVRTDLLLWKRIHIGHSLCNRITDGILVKLTSRAQGTLQCLYLVNCIWITDSGLTTVLKSNPTLKKLCVPGCIGLTIEGIISNLRALKSSGTHGIKLLRISGIGRLAGITDQQFKELKDLLGADEYFQQRNQKPQIYQGRFAYLTCDDDRPIDIDTCPQCQNHRRVYDCPAEICQQKHQAAQLHRGCILCIRRCVLCGRCIINCEYEETFRLELICLDCSIVCPDEPVQKDPLATKCTISQSTMFQFCNFCLHG